jgi:hypothetical protein
VSLAGFRVFGLVGASGVTSLINGTLSLSLFYFHPTNADQGSKVEPGIVRRIVRASGRRGVWRALVMHVDKAVRVRIAVLALVVLRGRTRKRAQALDDQQPAHAQAGRTGCRGSVYYGLYCTAQHCWPAGFVMSPGGG